MSVVKEASGNKQVRESGGMIRSGATRVGDWVIALVCFIVMFVCLLPMLNVLARSLSSAESLMRNEVFLWPKGWNLVAYQTILGNAKYIHSLWFTAILTVGVTENVLTIPAAALNQRGSRSFVYTGYDPESRTLLNSVDVTVGVSDGQTAEILSGLNEGDTVWYAYYEAEKLPSFLSSQPGEIM